MDTPKKAATIFEHIAHLTDKKTSWDSLSELDKKSFSPFIVNRWLSMNMDFIELVNDLQRYTVGHLAPSETYKLYHDILPRKKQFNKYIKGKKESKYNLNLVDLLATHFSVSKKEAIDYIDILMSTDSDKLNEIIKKYGKTDKEILALLKIEK